MSVPGPSRETVAGDKLADVPTVTSVDAVLNPEDEVVMVAVPAVMPLITTERLGVV